MKILLAVDGSTYTKKMLVYLVQNRDMFATHNQSHTLLTVLPPLPVRVRNALSKEQLLQYQAEETDKVLEPVLTWLARHDIRPQVLSRVGDPGSTIAAVAREEKFGLVIMGSHGQGALGNLLMGSVATRVLAECEVPVLLVR